MTRAVYLTFAAAGLLWGCTGSPQARAALEARSEVARREAAEPASAAAAPALTHEDIMVRSGEAARMERWGDRLAARQAQHELRQEVSRRTSELDENAGLLNRAETIDEREARLAIRQRLSELHGELIVLAAAPEAGPDAPRPAAYGLDPDRVFQEIERLSKERARVDYLKQRSDSISLCRRALRAMTEAEQAGQ